LHRVANRLLADDGLARNEKRNQSDQSSSAEGAGSQMRAKTVMVACQVVGWVTGASCIFSWPAMSSEVSTSEFLTHCEAAPEPCKDKVLAYVKFLADGGFLNKCITRLPAAETAAKLIEWMHNHPEEAGEDWVDCLDDAVAALKLCSP
jgi:hypothetical protein